jgi:hypothetical protein
MQEWGNTVGAWPKKSPKTPADAEVATEQALAELEVSFFSTIIGGERVEAVRGQRLRVAQ